MKPGDLVRLDDPLYGRTQFFIPKVTFKPGIVFKTKPSENKVTVPIEVGKIGIVSHIKEDVVYLYIDGSLYAVVQRFVVPL